MTTLERRFAKYQSGTSCPTCRRLITNDGIVFRDGKRLCLECYEAGVETDLSVVMSVAEAKLCPNCGRLMISDDQDYDVWEPTYVECRHCGANIANIFYGGKE